jgi:methyltransferase family protein/acetyltransferase (GNAT) family protein
MSRRRPPGEAEPALWQVEWRWLPGPDAADDAALMESCARLYSAEYGVWGLRGPKPGAPVTRSAERIRELLAPQGAMLACAFMKGSLVGYCAAVRFDVYQGRHVAWITQLVVASSYRHHRIATMMMYSVWGFSNCWAWGLVTANPLAVRALETATRRPCRSALITSRGVSLVAHLSELVGYIPGELLTTTTGARLPKVDSGFFVSHEDLPRLRRLAAREERPWALGDIAEGEEWFACTFGDQAPTHITDAEMTDLLTGADAVWIQAYERMTLDEAHRWRRHHEGEVDLILRWTELAPPATVLDVGCGDGRHAFDLSDRGLSVTAIDISPNLIKRATERRNDGPSFIVGDARDISDLPDGHFDLLLCLYDVIGSSASCSAQRGC